MPHDTPIGIEFISQQYFFEWNLEFLDAVTFEGLYCEISEVL